MTNLFKNMNETNPEEEQSTETPPVDACAKCDEYKFGWQRALADYDNLKKDLGKEKDQMRRAVKESGAHELIPVLDNLDQALKFQPQDLDDKTKSWLQGVMHVRAQIEQVLNGMGAEAFGNVGDTFDPHKHDAVKDLSPEGSEGESKIVEIVQRGWKIGDQMIRPAAVVVENK